MNKYMKGICPVWDQRVYIGYNSDISASALAIGDCPNPSRNAPCFCVVTFGVTVHMDKLSLKEE
jgi:hypothetical protein